MDIPLPVPLYMYILVPIPSGVLPGAQTHLVHAPWVQTHPPILSITIVLFVIYSGFTKNPQIIAFNGNNCTLRRADGAVIMTRYYITSYHTASLSFCRVSPFPLALHNHVNNSHWVAALKLCRMAKVWERERERERESSS